VASVCKLHLKQAVTDPGNFQRDVATQINAQSIVLDLVTKIIVHFYIDSILDFLSKFDYFHIHMDYVILYRSTEWK
jgi:hypothetical protein